MKRIVNGRKAVLFDRRTYSRPTKNIAVKMFPCASHTPLDLMQETFVNTTSHCVTLNKMYCS